MIDREGMNSLSVTDEERMAAEKFPEFYLSALPTPAPEK